MAGIIEVKDQGKLRIYDADNSHYIDIVVPSSVTANRTITIPDASFTVPQADTNTVYTHPNHSGEVTSSADGATVIADNIVDEANLKVSNSAVNGYMLTAQSGNTGGLTWAEAGGGDVVLLATTNITGNTGSVTFDGNFSSTYKNYQIIASNVVLASNVKLNWRSRVSSSDYTSSNYFEVFDNAQGESGESAANIDRGWGNNVARLCNKNLSSDTDKISSFILTIFDPLDTNFRKNFKAEYVINSANSDKLVTGNSGYQINNTAALTGISFFPESGNIARANFKLYGIK